MKIEKININKIKVTFTPEDLIEHNLTPEAVRDNAPMVQRVLMNIVRKAEEEIGFSASDCRLMVEAMPGRDDTMVMYITRLDGEDDLQEAMQSIKRKIRLRVRPNTPQGERKLCISFSDFEDAVSLAQNTAIQADGRLYFYEGRYHLIVSADAPAFFSEFGSASTDERLCDIISEHGKLISENPLSDLKTYFDR